MEEIDILTQIKELSRQISFKPQGVSVENGEQSLVLADKDDKLHALVPVENLSRLLANIKQLREENFELKLEKAIWKYVPIDFADTWAVVMNELESSDEDITDAESLSAIVKSVKQKHPNLFLNIDDFLPGEIRHI